MNKSGNLKRNTHLRHKILDERIILTEKFILFTSYDWFHQMNKSGNLKRNTHLRHEILDERIILK
jgi:hypothetical protein